VHIFHPQTTKFFSADAVMQSSEDGAIPDAFERVSSRGFQQFSNLPVAKRRRTTFVTIGHGPFYSVYRIADDGVALAKIIKERSRAESLRRTVAGAKSRPSISLRRQ
jgi:hypothetical protein